MDRAMAERVPRELLSEAQHERARAEAQLLQERADMDERQRKCEAGKEAAVQELSARIAQASRLWCKASIAPETGQTARDGRARRETGEPGERRASRARDGRAGRETG